jgi:hypothetical protein
VRVSASARPRPGDQGNGKHDAGDQVSHGAVSWLTGVRGTNGVPPRRWGVAWRGGGSADRGRGSATGRIGIQACSTAHALT